MRELDENQKLAVECNNNVVVSAGAGAGKTTVLSERYLRLISEGKAGVENILTLTFTRKAAGEARKVEEQFDDMFIYEKGSRRDAWINPINIKNKLIKDKNWLELEFILPKSSYATVLIENIANKNFK